MRYLLLLLPFLFGCQEKDARRTDLVFDTVPMERRPFQASMTYHDLVYTSMGYAMDIYEPYHRSPHERLPVVLALHSGGFLSGDKDNDIIKRYAMDIASTGEYVVATIDYSTVWDIGNHIAKKSPRRTHYMEYPIHDVHNAIDYLKLHQESLGILGDSIILMGYSAGGILVNEVMLSSRSIPSSIVAGVSIAACVTDREPLEYRKLRCPLLMIHGTKDEYVPYFKGRPFPDLEKNLKIDLPGVRATTSINDMVNDVSLMLGIELPKSWVNGFFDALFDDVHGSGRIFERYVGDEDIHLVTIEGAPHQFMKNKQQQFTETYATSVDHVIRFLEVTARPTP